MWRNGKKKLGKYSNGRNPNAGIIVGRVGSSSMLNLDGFYYGPHRTAPVYRSIPLVNLRYHYIRSKSLPHRAPYEVNILLPLKSKTYTATRLLKGVKWCLFQKFLKLFALPSLALLKGL